MRNIGIEFKVIFAVVFLTLFIVIIDRYELSQNTHEQFIESKKSKNKLLIDTITPIVSLNFYLGLYDANKNYLDQIVKQNSDLSYIKLIDTDNNIIYTSLSDYQNEFQGEKDLMNFSSKDIVDTVTKKKLATIELYFLNADYKLFLEKNKYTTIEVFALTTFLLIAFILVIKIEFRELKELSRNVLSYDPKKNNLKISKSNRMDEVGIIHNAIMSMADKISFHTRELDEINASLEEKVKQRTSQLNELNQSLNDRINIAVKELEQKNKLLLQQSRLAQMGEMISMIAHQWRQPLTSISSVISDLTMKIHLDKYDKELFLEKFAKVDEYTQHLSSTINDFRNFFEPVNDIKKVKLETLIDDTIKIIDESMNSKNIKLEKNIQSNKTYMTYDNELRQVLINIISNSMDALIENHTSNPKITIKTSTIDNKEVLVISDNGGGIDEKIIDKIFDPYFSTKKSMNGTGLGLYMSKIIVEEHCQGKLRAYNDEHGAVFEILLPQ